MTTLPAGINIFLANSYPNIKVLEIEKKYFYGYKLKLANDIDLKFDKEGNFIGIDD